MVQRAGDALGIANPYFRVHEGIAGARSTIEGQIYDNFVSYNYLGLNGSPRVSDAAKNAIDRYGTSVSASRIVSGERPIHLALEEKLAAIYRTEDALTLVSGHATNVTVIGHLVGRGDLIVHDALSHNSIVQGALLSGAQRIAFPHNDMDELDRLLGQARSGADRALIVVEGHYSMDGDIPDLARLITIARRHRAHIMVDEAHSLGVLGTKGHGIFEHSDVDPGEIDVWMGTLSKTLSGCGGYIAGSRQLIEYLRYSAPGFVYSVGLPPPIAAAALASLEMMAAEPERIARLQANSARFLKTARAHGLDTGLSIGSAIVPVMTGSSIVAARAADALFARGINVQPIIYPAVPEQGARLRFFISSLHEQEQLDRVARSVAETIAELRDMPVDLTDLANRLAAR
ncbi:aminotransferase class I/II-fold pyridoxal phosphate-dependent enzyme [Sphingomonas sp. BIUV-7]|uniref:Aminotransferase class I/II-fold pyridoxal phosphate-dependent enzyme n=1 Tax=Sphingomonas natans TaxID=3063330 RepID=A0ABT8Y5Q1_9SPHN|nr:aminotransferase class I/II-fold pyridoxal phosphate-dependent enzyme [Sphingomonas sp. BIUV-7]MDO6413650.1 aminotransferase class I/II-fold pyridoxal phosphate-dependent enzyme [Sphingomonas sp. BIUV-7]